MRNQGEVDALHKVVDELRQQWQGKNIRTERVISEDEAPQWLGAIGAADWHPGYRWGGCGIAVDFVERNGRVFVQSDEGMEWVVDDRTVIQDNTWAEPREVKR